MDVSRGAIDDLLDDGPVTWLLAGDSITEGWGLSDPRCGYAGLFVDYLRRDAGPVRARDAVRNSGLAGATVGEALSDFERRVERHGADIVSILFGMNDAGWGIAGIDRFQNGLETFVAKVVDLGALPILQTPYPVGQVAMAVTTHSRRTSMSSVISTTRQAPRWLTTSLTGRTLTSGGGGTPIRGMWASVATPNSPGS